MDKFFDWDRAAGLINEYKNRGRIVVYAGLEEDWDSTSDVIFEDNKPKIVDPKRTKRFFYSYWATPVMEINNLSNPVENIIIPCYLYGTKEFDKKKWESAHVWPESALEILGSNVITYYHKEEREEVPLDAADIALIDGVLKDILPKYQEE